MKLLATKSARIISWLAGLIIAVTTLGIPLGYYVVSYQYVLGSLETEAEINANIVTQIISANPEFWEFEQVRLVENLSSRPKAGYQETRRLINTKNALVAESSDKLTPPVVTQSHAVMDSGVIVGRIEIVRSLRPLLKGTGLLALLLLPVGLGVFIALYVLPIRVIRRTEEALEKTNRDLQMEISARQRSEQDVRRLNEELESQVAERTSQLFEAQEELIRYEKMAILGRLAATVGHELRNPLGVMSNAVYFLKTVLADADETVREYLGILKKEIDGSERIITDLLDFSRTKTPQPRPVPVQELINKSCGRCVIPENVILHVEIPETLPLVNIDTSQIGQVFQNLITNAVQSMPEGGELRISSRSVQKRGSAEARDFRTSSLDRDFIEISVTDTGEGISSENMKRLFQPLFTTKTRGIGLGLTVVKNLTEANGGRIEVESQLRKGTTFTVILPAAGKGQ